MNPFRIVLSFALTGLGVYQGLRYPGQQTAWFILAGVSFVVGVIRLIKYRKTGSQTGSQTGSGTENQQ